MGAALLALGGALAGLGAAEQLKRNSRTLWELETGLGLLEQELQLGGLTLEQLMEELAPRSPGESGRLFADCGAALSRRDRPAFPVLWEKLIGEREGWPPACRETLGSLGQTLGRCDSPEQRQAIRQVRERLEALRRTAEEERRSRGRLFQTVGLTGGAFLAVLLL